MGVAVVDGARVTRAGLTRARVPLAGPTRASVTRAGLTRAAVNIPRTPCRKTKWELRPRPRPQLPPLQAISLRYMIT